MTQLTFDLEFLVTTEGGAQTVTLRYVLPLGLHFGSNPPTVAEGCAIGPPVICKLKLTTNEVGGFESRKNWRVVADAAGVYEITANVEGDLPDPNPANNSFTYRVEVRQSGGSGGGGGTGGGSAGGGSTAVSTSTVRLSPATPKAGSTIVATVRVTTGGSPVRPTGIACAATIGTAKVKGAGKAASGSASCLFKTPKSGKGRTLRGTVSFTAGGKTFAKRFAVRLG